MSSITTTTTTTTTTITSTIKPFATGVQYGFYFDQSRCDGCHACAVACRSWNNIGSGPVKFLRLYEWEEGDFPNVRLNFLFAPCYHCANPVCVTAAQGAMYKEPNYGVVLVDPYQSTSPNLKAAADACPYGAIVFDSDSASSNAYKCTMCIDRLTQGIKPACVLACTGRALDFDTMANLKTKYGTNQQLSGMPAPTATNPSVVFKPQRTKTQIVPYDVPTALTLLSQRGTYPPLFSSSSDVTDPTGTYVKRNTLVMKDRKSVV